MDIYGSKSEPVVLKMFVHDCGHASYKVKLPTLLFFDEKVFFFILLIFGALFQ